MLWDRLFGTFQEERDDEPCIYGVRGQLKSWNPVWANLHYWWLMAMDCWHAQSWLDKLRVWIAPPGWRPPDVAARFPKAPYDPYRDFSRFDPPRNLALSVYRIRFNFSPSWLPTATFWGCWRSGTTGQNAAYFAFLLGSLVCLGGVLESRREFLQTGSDTHGRHCDCGWRRWQLVRRCTRPESDSSRSPCCLGIAMAALWLGDAEARSGRRPARGGVRARKDSRR